MLVCVSVRAGVVFLGVEGKALLHSYSIKHVISPLKKAIPSLKHVLLSARHQGKNFSSQEDLNLNSCTTSTLPAALLSMPSIF